MRWTTRIAGLGLLVGLGVSGAWAQPAEVPQPPEAEATATTADEELQGRLSAVFDNLRGLERLDVRVDSGVVHLSGPVLDVQAEQRAIEVAESFDDVVAVEPDIVIERDVRRRLAPLFADLRDRAVGWIVAVPTVLVALLVAFLFWWVGSFIAAREGLTRRWAPNPFVADFLKLLLHGAIAIFGIVIALEIVGATAFLGSILGALGLAGLAVGIAVRDTVENFIASLLLSVRQPFAPQDHVTIDGHEGRVARLTSRATILMNFEGNHVRIPNAVVYKGTIVNYTRNPNRRFDFEVGITTEGDPAVAQEVALEAVRTIPTVLDNPEPACLVDRLGDSNVVLAVFAWVDQTQASHGKTKSAAINAVKRAFEERGIGMPEPTYSVNLSREIEREPAASPAQAPAAQEQDLQPDRHLEEQAEVYAAGPDLLDKDAPQE